MKRVFLLTALVCMIMVSCKPDGGNGKHEGHEYVDLGLSVKWATCNVGADNPSDYGHYFAWGETSPKAEYTEDNCSTYGKQISDITGDAQYDAATANWGGGWRMPTEGEMSELLNNCTWTWTTQDGINGYNVVGTNGNSIFLPAAGDRYGSLLDHVGSYGNYWVSTPGESTNNAYDLHFGSDKCRMNDFNRSYGQSVRPVVKLENPVLE